MTEDRDRCCAQCGGPLTETQRKFCSRQCVRLSSVARAGATKWKDHEYQPHGTSAALRRHYRRGTPVCIACRQFRSRTAKRVAS